MYHRQQPLALAMITRGEIRERLEREGGTLLSQTLQELVRAEAVETYPDEPVRASVYRMAEKGVTRMPVVERQTRRLLGGANAAPGRRTSARADA